MGVPSKRFDRGPLREGLILAAFALLCGVAAWTVVLPELEDQGEPLADPAAGEADAGTDVAAAAE